MSRMLAGTDEPVFERQYAGPDNRLSIVDGLVRLEQQIRRGRRHLIEPSHDTSAMMICANDLLKCLHQAEEHILRLKQEKGRLPGAGS